MVTVIIKMALPGRQQWSMRPRAAPDGACGNVPPMKLLYFYRVPVPDPRADAVQVVQTCAGIARAGWDVSLHVETAAAPLSEVLGFYGADLPDDGAGRMELTAIGRRWSWPFLAWRIRGLRRQVRGTRSCLFVREVRPYVPGLMARARRWGVPAIYEAHNVSARLVEEKRDLAASRPHAAGLRRLSRKAEARARLEREILAGMGIEDPYVLA